MTKHKKPNKKHFKAHSHGPFSFSDNVRKLYVLAVQCFSRDILGVHIQESAGNEEQNIRRDCHALQDTEQAEVSTTNKHQETK